MVNPDEQALVRCETTAGSVTMRMMREWSPNGYDKVVELFERGFYDQSHFYRVVPKFLVQFGISYTKDKALQQFGRQKIMDDPPLGMPFRPGLMSFAGNGENSRTSQIFISYCSAKSLGTQKWETPFGEVIEGMEHVENLFSYGDMPPWGKGPVQGKIYDGPSYIEDNFPKLDKILHCKVERLNQDKDEVIGVNVLHKADKLTDEEDFQMQREAGLNSPFRRTLSKEFGDNDQILLVSGALVAAIMIVMLAMKNRTKILSKSN